ncbi:hypothetical protein SAMN05443574_13911 [Haloarcula vallismortis]|uniref:Uncharacterized protein n=2 Tax=Haloarcula vallismortis TaxID=28442 RepID=M0JPG5_HALVA|nr:hypothetical protein [Haloarcula vallismortis]EMA09560.1 hypothetical protein C437_05515 [Haloarcula vallismortis ATCC 29715]SDX37766.1 hypothetical protein SAMN05443574_13911 [Haloarcula vallismortis]
MLVDNSLAGIILLGLPILGVYEALPGVAGGVIATVLGVTATIRGVKNVSDWWGLSTTDSVPLRESVTTDGLVRIDGTVRPPRSEDTLVSPIRGEECVAYEYNIYHQVQGTGDPSIDAGIECSPFVVSDGTVEIYVNPTEESLSLAHETETVIGEELLEQVDEARLDLESSATTDSGLFKDPIELVEGTLSVGETVSVVGNASTAPETDAGGADGVMTPAAGNLIVANDKPESAALRTGARGLFVLVLGLALDILGIGALVANTGSLVKMLQLVGWV